MTISKKTAATVGVTVLIVVIVTFMGIIAFKSNETKIPDHKPELSEMGSALERMARALENLELSRTDTPVTSTTPVADPTTVPPAPSAPPATDPAPSADPTPTSATPTTRTTASAGGTIRRERVTGDYNSDSYTWERPDGSRGSRATLYKGGKPKMELPAK